ncbi:branched-chain amino acid transaminase [Campylobacter sp. RM9344]|uniref:Branched-chain-amino-acid aminotransferase n=1 Tax=Campylobacter californiensis TaxID=1032243 RepID=A0AAW3ZVV8_9BACT|nr:MULTISPECIES: branched-chain amino acid transaminase [unclassified Campylobacter]MBE2984637.1 branched-chain amino acid transaminase [Campylobacter sp. RM6883]MBE2986829.1 branched-chain amino acid transaminase [Campylobacter sp. RM12919]MBE2988493.1 branched-chain amino acid transaminase [Campylobacter sp. RM12920]MBE2995075.1 branched-chain amino acid transaminase [Campylobacter sp. RM6913]MBE3021616.1 branched-chain amino acid transaminase [Campylobacter sp. 7477a]MBE3028996.1 branched-
MDAAEFIWMDGKLIKWEDAKVHVLTHSLHYANAVFEGTRAYQTDKGLAIFRLRDHTKRLLKSAKMTVLNCKYTLEELENAQIELLRANKFKGNVYLRPLIYLGYGIMGLAHTKAPVNTAIAAWEWGAYLGEEGLKKGIRVKISSFAKYAPNSQMTKAKSSSNYLTSQMANYEAKDAGYDEALLLDEEGFVAEGPGECFFIVENGELVTPPSDNALLSITQDTVIKLACDLGIKVRRERLTRDQVYTADEAFFTGTAAEVTPISNIDNRIIGSGERGEVTKRLQDAYFDVVYGKNEKYASFLTYI